jgi:hypothetical protein
MSILIGFDTIYGNLSVEMLGMVKLEGIFFAELLA